MHPYRLTAVLPLAAALALAGCGTTPATEAPPELASAPSEPATRGGEPIEEPTATASYSRPPITLVPGSFATKYASVGVSFPWSAYPAPEGDWNPGEAAWGCQYMVSTVKPDEDAGDLVVALLAARKAEHPEESRADAGEAVIANIDGVCKPFVIDTANAHIDSLES